MAAVNADNLGEYVHSEAEVNNEQPTETPIENNQEAEVPQEAPVVEEEVPTEEEVPENPWDIEHLKGEDGLVAGKFKSIDAMVKSLEHAESKLVELQAEKQSTKAKGKNAQAAEAKATEISNAENIAINKYVETGLMTPELIAEIEAAGGSATSVELRGIKAQQQITKLQDITGGADNFSQMINDMSVGKSEADKQSWLASISDPNMSEYAVKGLYSEWLEQTGQRPAAKRINGKPPMNSGVKPYATQGEMLQDAARARHDKVFRSEYENRKSITPDTVFFNR